MSLPDAVAKVVATATGRAHRDDPVTPGTGGPAGNAQLTAWLGLVLLALFAVELVTLADLHQLLTWHILIGAFLVPPALAKTTTTGWRVLRYYRRDRSYLQAGPPPLLLRALGPVVVVSTLAVLGTGLALVALGPDATFTTAFTIAGQRVDPLTMHQASFVVWIVATGLHVLARTVPAVQLAVASRRGRSRLPAVRRRTLVLVATVGVGVIVSLAVTGLAGSWTGGNVHRFDHPTGPPLH